MITFRAQLGTVFCYTDPHGNVRVVADGTTTAFPVEDLMEFAVHLSGVLPSDTPFDLETDRLIMEHVERCTKGCRGTVHCEDYWRLMIGRFREKERMSVH